MSILKNLLTSVTRSRGKTPRVVNGIEIPVELDFVGGHLFEETGNEFLTYFKKYGGLEPDHAVLDVGCGIGRMAIPLTAYLSEKGSYKGFDIVPEGIEWCQKNISPIYPSFEFSVADIYNKLYNPTGTQQSVNYKFPYDSDSFDFIFLTSVFTHMYAEDMENYLAEIARVLKPGGTCLITYFLINDDSQKKIDSGNSLQNFQHTIGECHIVDKDMPEGATGYRESFIRDLHTKYGLEITEPVLFGGWSGRLSFVSYQDIVCARKL